MKDKLKFNKKPKYKSRSLYSFNRYLNTFEESNYILFVKYYYKLTANRLKYYRKPPFSKSRRRSCNYGSN